MVHDRHHHHRRRSTSPGASTTTSTGQHRHGGIIPPPHPAPRRAVRPLLALVALVNLAWSLYQLPVSRVVESRLCREHYAAHNPSVVGPGGEVPEGLCKVDEVQKGLGRVLGGMEVGWVAGDFLMTIPLVSLADRYGHRLVLCLNLVPRIFLLAWTFAVGYFDRALPVKAVLAAPALSFFGGDCVFNSIVYSLVSELTDDHVLRATFFGHVNAIASIFSLQLGPAIASATMTALLWLPFWLGIALLLLALPIISALPTPSPPPPPSEEQTSLLTPPPPNPSARTTLSSTTASRLRALRALLANPSRNFALLLAVFFLASLASSDTKLLTLYVSKRYPGWTFADVGYLLSAKAVFNFFFLWGVVPRFLAWRRKTAATATENGDRENVVLARACLVVSVAGALAIAAAPTVGVLVPALLVYALGIALPVFTYSLLKARGMGVETREGGSGTQLFSVMMLARTVGALVGAAVMPALWVKGVGMGGSALGLPFVASAGLYAVAAVVVKRIVV
ncbi:hypothetical protein C8A05DRAFT_17270 [Staphylotrichum tortipilum]|uniref:Major facilitator superfamily transporter n=1 Tax=Staphylotrichum tortipilum TaxID=2831512 RepID=A0AAN6MHQ1_9PEZI|nr:hypothetical protein C8A05DRAFT_17270 [Staphylotrichum longicolle]